MANVLLNTALKEKVITNEQFKKAVAYKEEASVTEETALRDTKILTDEEILKLYEKIYSYQTALEIEMPNPSLAKLFKASELMIMGFFPEEIEGRIRIISSKPTELLYAEDIIRDKTGYRGAFRYVLVTISTLTNIIEQTFREESGSDDEFDIEGEGGLNDNIYNIVENDTSAVVRLVNRIFKKAIEDKASDVHFEPQDDGFHIRFRKDGSLKNQYTYPMSISRQVTNRIKTMANLDVNSSKIIQDGNTRLNIFGKMVDLRISVIPASHGENLVVRILDQNKGGLDISMIGFSKDNEEKFKKLIHRPQGIMLLTGPTGSGKSTSLYAAISELNTEDRCIITFEDPIEYRIPGIIQVQINTPMGVTFPDALKSGLRQDIEVALVGEIRDSETASIAFDAANTGHMVFSTLHTNSAASSIMRLVKMGVEPYVVSRTLIGVINQRLAKRICPDCIEEYTLEKDSPYMKILKEYGNEITLYRGKGCKKCNGTGYYGRVAIQEFMEINDEIGDLLDNGATTHEIEQAAIKNGMKTIHQDGIEKALKGITTLDEIHRTVFFDEL